MRNKCSQQGQASLTCLQAYGILCCYLNLEVVCSKIIREYVESEFNKDWGNRSIQLKKVGEIK